MSPTASGPERHPEPPSGGGPEPNPAPLITAVSLVAVEGIVVTMFGIAELASLTEGRLAMGLTAALFFTAYGVGLIAASWGLTRQYVWARGPVLVAQLFQLGLAWNLWGGVGAGSALVAIAVGLVAVVVLAGMLHPASVAALDGGRPE